MTTTEHNTEMNGSKEIVNKVILTGFLGKDPTLDTVGSNKLKVAKFSMATNNDYRNSKGENVKSTLWHNVVAWGKLATEVAEKLKKGNRVTIEGKISYNIFTDKNGVKKQYTDIVMHDMVQHTKKEAA